MTESSTNNSSEPVTESPTQPFRSVFWDDLEKDLEDPEFAELYAEETAKTREALK